LIISKPEVKDVGEIGEIKQKHKNYMLKLNIITSYFSNINI
jgi:hypothetical protein